MSKWRENLVETVQTIEKSNSLNTKLKVYEFFETEFTKLTDQFANRDIAKIEQHKGGYYFLIYKRYFRLEFNEESEEIYIYVPSGDGTRKYATIYVNFGEETYAKLENTESLYDASEYYIDEIFVDEVFEMTYRNIKKES